MGFIGTRGQGMGISPVTLTSRFLQSARAPGDSLRSLCLTHGADRRYLTMRHCPKSLNRLSNLTSAQKKAKKHMKEAREEAEIAVLQRFWVKSAIGRIIRRDCS